METQVTNTMKPVVVGVDGSEASQDALDWAVVEGQLTGRSLKVLYSYTLAPGSAPMDKILREIGHEVLDAANARVRARAPELVVDSDLHYGPPVSLLLEQSREAAVLVVGGRGAGSFAALLLGSVAVGVTAHAHCPVVVVRGTQGAPGNGEGSRVVVGVDGSEPSVAAVEFAIAEASRRRLPLHALSAWQLPPLYEPTMYPELLDPEIYETESREALSEQLAGWREKYPDVPVTEVVERLHPVEALVRASRTADLVVVGCRGRGGFRGMLLGSVGQGLIRHAHCPVAVVHAHHDAEE
jgi:nucleotide-binding universal stress UspA family protein